MNKNTSLFSIAATTLLLSGCLASTPFNKEEPGTTAATSPGSASTSPAAASKTAKLTPTSTYERKEVKGRNDWSGYIEGKPAPKSNFPKLEIGMSMKEVWDKVGHPTDQAGRTTAKAYIPFWGGAGLAEYTHYYKGRGRLIFSSSQGSTTNLTLIGIEHDAKESGYAKN